MLIESDDDRFGKKFRLELTLCYILFVQSKASSVDLACVIRAFYHAGGFLLLIFVNNPG
jgi:hypothetical protein